MNLFFMGWILYVYYNNFYKLLILALLIFCLFSYKIVFLCVLFIKFYLNFLCLLTLYLILNVGFFLSQNYINMLYNFEIEKILHLILNTMLINIENSNKIWIYILYVCIVGYILLLLICIFKFIFNIVFFYIKKLVKFIVKYIIYNIFNNKFFEKFILLLKWKFFLNNYYCIIFLYKIIVLLYNIEICKKYSFSLFNNNPLNSTFLYVNLILLLKYFSEKWEIKKIQRKLKITFNVIFNFLWIFFISHFSLKYFNNKIRFTYKKVEFNGLLLNSEKLEEIKFNSNLNSNINCIDNNIFDSHFNDTYLKKLIELRLINLIGLLDVNISINDYENLYKYNRQTFKLYIYCIQYIYNLNDIIYYNNKKFNKFSFYKKFKLNFIFQIKILIKKINQLLMNDSFKLKIKLKESFIKIMKLLEKFELNENNSLSSFNHYNDVNFRIKIDYFFFDLIFFYLLLYHDITINKKKLDQKKNNLMKIKDTFILDYLYIDEFYYCLGDNLDSFFFKLLSFPGINYAVTTTPIHIILDCHPFINIYFNINRIHISDNADNKYYYYFKKIKQLQININYANHYYMIYNYKNLNLNYIYMLFFFKNVENSTLILYNSNYLVYLTYIYVLLHYDLVSFKILSKTKIITLLNQQIVWYKLFKL